jgi:hypothetical protein
VPPSRAATLIAPPPGRPACVLGAPLPHEITDIEGATVSVTERDRRRLFKAFEETWGEEIAMIIAEHLPPGGWSEVATQHDIRAVQRDIEVVRTELRNELHYETGALRKDIEALRETTEARFEGLRQEMNGRFASMGSRFDSVDSKFDSLEHRLSSRMDQKFAEQTRAMIVAFVGALMAFGSLVLAAAMLGRP